MTARQWDDIWQNVAPILEKFEGFEPSPYQCPAGVLTVGYGHTLTNQERRQATQEEGGNARVGPFPLPLTRGDALTLLHQDCQAFWRRMVPMIRAPLWPHQTAALLSFAYNVGLGAFQRSTLRQKLNRGEADAVPAELLRWVRVQGKFCQGLYNRRRAEGDLFRCQGNGF